MKLNNAVYIIRNFNNYETYYYVENGREIVMGSETLLAV